MTGGVCRDRSALSFRLSGTWIWKMCLLMVLLGSLLGFPFGTEGWILLLPPIIVIFSQTRKGSYCPGVSALLGKFLPPFLAEYLLSWETPLWPSSVGQLLQPVRMVFITFPTLSALSIMFFHTSLFLLPLFWGEGGRHGKQTAAMCKGRLGSRSCCSFV